MYYRAFSTIRITVMTTFAATALLYASEPAARPLADIQPNDNRQAAGTLDGGMLVLHLRAGIGLLRPEGDAGPALEVKAFGEESGPLEAPAPLIRVVEGTHIMASI